MGKQILKVNVWVSKKKERQKWHGKVYRYVFGQVQYQSLDLTQYIGKLIEIKISFPDTVKTHDKN